MFVFLRETNIFGSNLNIENLYGLSSSVNIQECMQGEVEDGGRLTLLVS